MSVTRLRRRDATGGATGTRDSEFALDGLLAARRAVDDHRECEAGRDGSNACK
jgi:hypothetical protein